MYLHNMVGIKVVQNAIGRGGQGELVVSEDQIASMYLTGDSLTGDSDTVTVTFKNQIPGFGQLVIASHFQVEDYNFEEDGVTYIYRPTRRRWKPASEVLEEYLGERHVEPVPMEDCLVSMGMPDPQADGWIRLEHLSPEVLALVVPSVLPSTEDDGE